jgi:hypothetical protein
VPQILKVRPDLPPMSDNIINKAMAKNRDARYKSASDLTRDLGLLSTSRHSRDDLHDELEKMRNDATDVLDLKTPLPGEMPIPQPTNRPRTGGTPPPAVGPSRPISEYVAPPSSGLQSPQSAAFGTGTPGTGSAAPLPVADKKRPVWLIPLVAIFVVLCLGGMITLGVLGARGDLNTLFSSATDTPEPDEDDEEPPEDEEEDVVESMKKPPPTPSPHWKRLRRCRGYDGNRRRPTNRNAAVTPTAVAVDAVGTRTAIEQTRAAAAPPPPLIPISQDIIPLYGPIDGELPHEEDNVIETTYANTTPQNFVMQIVVDNPYDQTVGDWDFGLIFRQVEADDELRLVVRSDGLWTLNDRAPGKTRLSRKATCQMRSMWRQMGKMSSS